MSLSQLDRLRADIGQLEAELASLGHRPKLDAEAERRLDEIQRALPRLQAEVQRLVQATKLGA